ncbi:hypothetical protein SCLCIDRAFT_33477 [Scleroderma citrinum Foug A]|uniref:Uncharacterized protein n=1 Tax=Scleroderma citrinum Foug A TaxID=1036808 RepID=A0A0C2YNU8_9AGAM|nr:hypothetical protein SCLCIDRAFT_33477 [Scleroderma citrinum Foug A]
MSGSSKPANKPASSSTWPELTAKLGKDGTRHFADKCHKKAKQAKARTAAAAASRKPDSTLGASSKAKKDAPMEARLNVSALSDPNALIPLVSILPYNLENIHALVDSRSTHCFVDLQFVH